jgi:hypothetical protein
VKCVSVIDTDSRYFVEIPRGLKITLSNAMQQSPREKVIVTQLVKKFQALHET